MEEKSIYEVFVSFYVVFFLASHLSFLVLYTPIYEKVSFKNKSY